MIIRTASASDVSAVAEFNRRLALESERSQLDSDVVTAGVTALVADPAKGTYFLAEHEGQVVGQLMITFEWSDWRNGNIWWIQSVYVQPEFRGQGVFRKLLDHLLQLARSRPEVVALRLYMHADNARARRAYEKAGLHRTHYEVFEMALTPSPLPPGNPFSIPGSPAYLKPQ
jgi:GNAT superfamily N-acetyltransferase